MTGLHDIALIICSKTWLPGMLSEEMGSKKRSWTRTRSHLKT
jgi:hypothetical protein